MFTILVVEDSSVMRKIAVRLSEGLGLTVREAENGQVALSACQSVMPDAILLDWNMPVMDGPTFLKALRALPNGGLPKVVFCTTESDMDKIVAVMGDGADEFIMKPYDVDILRSKLEYVGLLSAEMT
jgi:two-component system chemotaxis response regulator CheY